MKGISSSRMNGVSKEAEYFSKDFDWEALKQEIENDPFFRYHLEEEEEEPSLPTSSSIHPPPPSSVAESHPWSKFHARHHTGKFFKVFSSQHSYINLNLYYYYYGCCFRSIRLFLFSIDAWFILQ